MRSFLVQYRDPKGETVAYVFIRAENWAVAEHASGPIGVGVQRGLGWDIEGSRIMEPLPGSMAPDFLADFVAGRDTDLDHRVAKGGDS